MNESSPTLPWWKHLWHILRSYAVEETIGVFVLGLLWQFGLKLWNWILENIQVVLPFILCAAALQTMVILAGLWIRTRKGEAVALGKISELEQLASELVHSIEEQKRRGSELEAENGKLRTSPDHLNLQQRRIVTCILCAGKISSSKIEYETGLHNSNVNEAMYALRYDHSLVHRCGMSEEGQELFELTEGGKQYAIEQGISAIDQGDQVIQQMAIDAEKQALKEQNDLLFKARREAEYKIEILEGKLAIVRETRDADQKALIGISGAFAAARATGLAAARRKSVASKLDQPFPKNHWADSEKSIVRSIEGITPNKNS